MKFIRLVQTSLVASLLFSTQASAAPVFNGGFPNPTGSISIARMVMDENNNLYIIERGRDQVDVLDPSGALINQITGPTGNPLKDPIRIAIDHTSNNIYVQEWLSDRTVVYNSAGTYTGEVNFSDSFTVAFNPNLNRIYGVSGYAYDPYEIYEFDATSNTYTRTIISASSGSGAGQFSGITDVTVDHVTNDLYIVDQYNERIQVFDSDGNYKFNFAPPEDIRQPNNIYIDPNTRLVYVAARSPFDIRIFDINGGYIDKFIESGDSLSSVEGIAVKPDSGTIYALNNNLNYPDIATLFWPRAWTKPGTATIRESVALDDELMLGSGYHLEVEKDLSSTENIELGTGSSLQFTGNSNFAPKKLVLNGGEVSSNADAEVKVTSPVGINTDTSFNIASNAKLAFENEVTGPGKITKEGAGEQSFAQKVIQDIYLLEGKVVLRDGLDSEISTSGSAAKTLELAGGSMNKDLMFDGYNNTFIYKKGLAQLGSNVKVRGGSTSTNNTLVFDGTGYPHTIRIDGDSVGANRSFRNFERVILAGENIVVGSAFDDEQVKEVIIDSKSTVKFSEDFDGNIMGNNKDQNIAIYGEVEGNIIISGGNNKVENYKKVIGNVSFGADNDILKNSGEITGDVTFTGGKNFLSNYGKISGKVIFSGGDDTLEKGPNAEFGQDSIDGGNGYNTLIKSGLSTKVDKISEVNKKFKNFKKLKLNGNRKVELDKNAIYDVELSGNASLYLGGNNLTGTLINNSPNTVSVYNEDNFDATKESSVDIYTQDKRGNLLIGINSTKGIIDKNLKVSDKAEINGGKFTVIDVDDAFPDAEFTFNALEAGNELKVNTPAEIKLPCYLKEVSSGAKGKQYQVKVTLRELNKDNLPEYEHKFIDNINELRFTNDEARKIVVSLLKCRDGGHNIDIRLKEAKPSGYGALNTSSVLQHRLFSDQLLYKLRYNTETDKFWIKGYGARFDQGNQSAPIFGYNQRVSGTMFGFDKEVSNNKIIGISAGFGQSQVKSKIGTTKGRADHYQGALYGSYSNGKIYTAGSATISTSTVRGDRRLQLTEERLSTGYNNYGLGLKLEGGLNYNVNKNLTVSPFVNLDVLYSKNQGAKEVGQGLSYKLDANSNKYAQGGIGISASGRKDLNHYALIPNFSLSYNREFASKGNTLHASIAGKRMKFETIGLPKDTIKVGIGVSGVSLGKKYSKHSLFGSYDLQVSNKSMRHNFTLGYRFKF